MGEVNDDAYDGEEVSRVRLCGVDDELAVAFDGDVMLRYGAADDVRAWVDQVREAVATAADALPPGLRGAAPDVTVVTFPVHPETISEVNHCWRTAGRVARFEERLAEILDDRAPSPGP